MSCSRFHLTQTTLGACPAINFDEKIIASAGQNHCFTEWRKKFNPNQGDAGEVFFELLDKCADALPYFLNNWQRTRNFIFRETFYSLLAALDARRITLLKEFLLSEPDFQKQLLWSEILKYRGSSEETWTFWKKIYALEDPNRVIMPNTLVELTETFINEKTPLSIKKELITLLLKINNGSKELFYWPAIIKDEILTRRWFFPSQVLFESRNINFTDEEFYTLLADLTSNEIKTYFAQYEQNTDLAKEKMAFLLASQDQNLVAANWASILKQLTYFSEPALWQTTADFLAQHGKEIIPDSLPPQTYLDQLQSFYQTHDNLNDQLKMIPVLVKIVPIAFLNEQELAVWQLKRHDPATNKPYQEKGCLYYSLLSRQKENQGDFKTATQYQMKAIQNFNVLESDYRYYQVLSPLAQKAMQKTALNFLKKHRRQQPLYHEIVGLGKAFFYATLLADNDDSLNDCFNVFFGLNNQRIASDLKNGLFKNCPLIERKAFARRLLRLAIMNPPNLLLQNTTSYGELINQCLNYTDLEPDEEQTLLQQIPQMNNRAIATNLLFAALGKGASQLKTIRFLEERLLTPGWENNATERSKLRVTQAKIVCRFRQHKKKYQAQ